MQTEIMGSEIDSQSQWIVKNGDVGDLARDCLDGAQNSLNKIK
jgi:hypothetical protein